MRIRYWKLAVTAAACSVLGGNAAMAQQRTAPVAAPAVKPVNYTTSSYYQPEAEAPDASASVPAAPAPVATEVTPSATYCCPPAASCCEEEESPWSFSGWLNASSNWNPANPRTSQNGINTFNYRANELQMNQLYLIGQRASNSDPDAFGIGGRVDLLYGTDWQFTPARGLELHNNGTSKWNGDSGGGFNDGFQMYGLAMPQAYLEFYAPVFGGVTTKVGHYYTLIGYEVVTAPDNFFITHNYSMQYGEPFTHTGFQSSVQATENIAISAGMNRGWDNWEDGNNDLGFLGMATYTNPTFGGSLAIAYQGSPENDEFPNTFVTATAGWRHVTSFVFIQPVTERLRYIFHSDIGWEDANPAVLGTDSAEWYSATNYFLLDLSEKLSVGMRTGYFRDDDGARIFSNPANDDVGGVGAIGGGSVGMAGNYWDLSLGNNYKWSENIITRGEVRYTWSDAQGIDGSGVRPYDDGARGSQLQMTSDIIVRF